MTIHGCRINAQLLSEAAEREGTKAFPVAQVPRCLKYHVAVQARVMRRTSVVNRIVVKSRLNHHVIVSQQPTENNCVNIVDISVDFSISLRM